MENKIKEAICVLLMVILIAFIQYEYYYREYDEILAYTLAYQDATLLGLDSSQLTQAIDINYDFCARLKLISYEILSQEEYSRQYHNLLISRNNKIRSLVTTQQGFVEECVTDQAASRK